jgi:hypothetical protein
MIIGAIPTSSKIPNTNPATPARIWTTFRLSGLFPGSWLANNRKENDEAGLDCGAAYV